MKTQPQQTDIDPDTLQRPEGNDLVSNYQAHDIGEAYLTGRLNERGFLIEEWGLDDRHNDGGLVFDNKMDLRLWEPLDGQLTPPQNAPDKLGSREANSTEYVGASEQFDLGTNSGSWNLCGVADVKTKTNEDWFGVFNLRHLTHYAQWAEWYESVPVFIYFTMVDSEDKRVHSPSGLVEVPSDWDFHALADHYDRDSSYQMRYGALKDAARECPIVDRVFRAPDGNLVVSVADAVAASQTVGELL